MRGNTAATLTCLVGLALSVGAGPAAAGNDPLEQCANMTDTPDELIAACRSAADRLPREKRHFAYNNLGNAYSRRGDNDLAIASYTQALELNPRYATALYNRGNSWIRKGDLDRAIADYSEALRLRADDAGAYNNRGLALQRKGDYDGAIADYTKAIALKPMPYLYRNRASAWRAKGIEAEALADLGEASRLEGTASSEKPPRPQAHLLPVAPGELARLIGPYPALKAAPIPAFGRLYLIGTTSSKSQDAPDPTSYSVALHTVTASGMQEGLAAATDRSVTSMKYVILSSHPAKLTEKEQEYRSSTIFALGGLLALRNSMEGGDFGPTGYTVESISDVQGNLFPLAKGNHLSLRLHKKHTSSHPFSLDVQLDYTVREILPSADLGGAHFDGGIAKIEQVTKNDFGNFTSEDRIVYSYSLKYGWVVNTETSGSSKYSNLRSEMFPSMILPEAITSYSKDALARYDEEAENARLKAVALYLQPKRAKLIALLSNDQSQGSGSASSQSNDSDFSTLMNSFAKGVGLAAAVTGTLNRDTNLANQGLDLFAKASGLTGASSVPGTQRSTGTPAGGGQAPAGAGSCEAQLDRALNALNENVRTCGIHSSDLIGISDFVDYGTSGPRVGAISYQRNPELFRLINANNQDGRWIFVDANTARPNCNRGINRGSQDQQEAQIDCFRLNLCAATSISCAKQLVKTGTSCEAAVQQCKDRFLRAFQ